LKVRHNRFYITNVSNGATEPLAIYTSEDAYRTRDALFFLWDKDDRVWVYSGDVGTFFWERINDNYWEKHVRSENKDVAVPDLLKKLRPKFFDK